MSSILISALSLSAAPAFAADDPKDGSDDVSAALARDLGLTPEQVKEQGRCRSARSSSTRSCSAG